MVLGGYFFLDDLLWILFVLVVIGCSGLEMTNFFLWTYFILGDF